MREKPHLLLIDGMALLFRAFYSTAVTGQYMVNSKGMPTNGVQGFLRHLLIAIEQKQASHIAVCWDMGSKTFRNELFDAYKSNREAPPIELIPQFDLAKEVVEAFQIPNIGEIGFEADDCIGTVAMSMKSDADVSILTGDRDLLQLLDQHIQVHLLQKGYGNYKSYTHEAFFQEYNVTPHQYIDVKALMGDMSDGYPGVKGIGEKTALKLIQQFKDIQGILDNLDALTNAQRKKIEMDLEMLHLSRELAEIKCDVPLQFTLEHAAFTEIPETFIEIVNDLELKTVKRHLLATNWNASPTV
ncbi:5'-3' exonuclease [Heyndrickxia ginsengihumi]|uniref:5'-3' exonuclease n=1 Tax=Heyndrickxia ginsengihumi TaxID=363870 RepID=A0A6M0P755_9BACI|nr:5'-3' exonuclease H3TH domain-containing protein [Heyndrickxia ginsengihumi]MBE6184926.1 5'-3' exonuclease [Bacillus sp. (in: firmicutes)]MCM3023497.1 5'-3' exonuclease [Heyndrickxia ginsengihumi]NEY20347.1 5'-3' exonuclease [Heyndrickxia ginsengihumi]